MGYQYALYQHRKKLREERDMVFQDNNSISREEYWEDYSEDSEYSRERHGDPKHNRGVTARSREERYSRSTTPQLEEEEDDFVQETPEAALVAAQAYLLTTRLKPGDPQEDMHRAAVRSLGIVGSKIREKCSETKSTSCKKNQKEEFKYNFVDNEYSESSEEERRQRRKEDTRNIIAWRETSRVTLGGKKIMKTTIKRWGCYALLAGFAKHGYPKDSNCHTTSISMTGHKNLPYGYQTICRQYRYWGEQRRLQCKVCSYTSPAQHGPG
jgi:hypothetical protein